MHWFLQEQREEVSSNGDLLSVVRRGRRQPSSRRGFPVTEPGRRRRCLDVSAPPAAAARSNPSARLTQAGEVPLATTRPSASAIISQRSRRSRPDPFVSVATQAGPATWGHRSIRYERQSSAAVGATTRCVTASPSCRCARPSRRRRRPTGSASRPAMHRRPARCTGRVAADIRSCWRPARTAGFEGLRCYSHAQAPSPGRGVDEGRRPGRPPRRSFRQRARGARS